MANHEPVARRIRPTPLKLRRRQDLVLTVMSAIVLAATGLILIIFLALGSA